MIENTTKDEQVNKFLSMNDLRILLSQLTSFDTSTENKLRLIKESKTFLFDDISNLDFVQVLMNGDIENSDEVIFIAFEMIYNKLVNTDKKG